MGFEQIAPFVDKIIGYFEAIIKFMVGAIEWIINSITWWFETIPWWGHTLMLPVYIGIAVGIYVLVMIKKNNKRILGGQENE